MMKGTELEEEEIRNQKYLYPRSITSEISLIPIQIIAVYKYVSICCILLLVRHL